MQFGRFDSANMADNQVKIIRDALNRFLATREHSRHELLNKLLAKGLDAECCISELDLFTANNLQSDERYAQSLVRHRVGKGYGEVRIRAELREQQIDDNTIDDALHEADVDWLTTGAAVLDKKFGKKTACGWSDIQKRKRFLQYKGFTYEQIQQLVGE